MSYVKKLVFFILFLFLGISATYALDYVCCYIPDSELTIKARTTQCPSGEIYVGDVDTDSIESGSDLCKQFEDTRQGCQVGVSCKAHIGGSFIYDLPEVQNYLGSKLDRCSSLIPFNSNCVGDAIKTPGNDNGTQIIPGDENNTYIIDDNLTDNPFDNEEARKICRDAGSPFGFYLSKQTCEAVEVNGESCLYNPYRAGKISTQFINIEDISFDYYEYGCIPKIDIWSCDDYKTKDNCQNNPSLGISPSILLEKGCKWVPAEDYAPNTFHEQEGICISNAVEENKNINVLGYSYRKNLVKESSFEQEPLEKWVFDGGMLVTYGSSLSFSFSGYNSYRLEDNNKMSQKIPNVATGVAYNLFLYAKPIGFDNSSRLKYYVNSYDEGGNIIDNANFTQKLTDYFSPMDEYYYEKIVFSSYIIPNGTYEIEITILSEELTVDIDAVSFEAYERTGISSNDLIYKPVEIISASASTCSKCFEVDNLNFCTPEKSSYMGDCTYMTKSIDKAYKSEISGYLGKKDNYYEINEPWGSQSMYNSKLFCELYTIKDKCLDPNNYVNSKYTALHGSSGDTLCKWDDSAGCFKDSNNDGFPDIKGGIPLLRSMPETEINNIYKNMFNGYVFESIGSQISDFILSCDSLPPNSYLYFEGYNSSGHPTAISGDYMNVLGGNVGVVFSMSDARVDACKDFNITPKLFIDFSVNGKSDYVSYEVNQEFVRESVKEFFVNSTGHSLVDEGINEISVIVKDQAGNIGRELTYKIDFDLNGPQVDLTSHILVDNTGIKEIEQMLGPLTKLTFNASDKSKIIGCNFTLEPVTSGIDSSFYNGTGRINLTGKESPKVQFDMTLPIYNSSENLDIYHMTMACYDVFNQSGTLDFMIKVDFNTDLVIIEPVRYTGFNSNYGFINGPTALWGVSADKNLTSCRAEYESETFDLTIKDVPEGFEIDIYPDVDFYKNVTGTLDFSSPGIKNGFAICQDNVGNIVKKNLTLLYDPNEPQILSYKLIGRESNGFNSVIEYNGEYYTTSDDPGYFNASLDGTGSWISDNLGWLYKMKNPDNNLSPYVKIGSVSFSLDKRNDSFIAQLTIDNIDSMADAFEYDTIDKNLVEMKHYLNFSDMAGNINMQEMIYYLDNSTPGFNFSGDIINQIDTKLYTSNSNPNIIVNFNVPEYRKHQCNITAQRGDMKFAKNFPATSSLSFTLSEFSSQLDLSVYNGIDLHFKCVDVYGYKLDGKYTLIYDNTPPQLNEIMLDKGNEKYYRNFENLIYPDTIDSIVFDLNDTGEEGYFCQYKFESTDSYYSCQNEWFEEYLDGGSGYKVTSPITIIGGSDTNGSTDYICERTSSFYSKQKQTIAASQDFETNLILRAKCLDTVDLSTKELTLEVSIDYINGELVDFYFEVTPNGIIPVVVTLAPAEGGITIAKQADGTDVLQLITSKTQNNSLYYYRGTPLDIDQLEEGDNTLWAIVFDSSSRILDKLSAVVFVDKIPPVAEIDIPDEQDGIVYSRDFEILLHGSDSNNNMEMMEFFIDGTKVYDTRNLSQHSSKFLFAPLPSENYCSGSNCEGRLIFTNGTYETSHTFKLIVYDAFGNSNSTQITISIIDGMNLSIKDSIDAFVDPSGFRWGTKATAPTIAFETAYVVDYCTIYPMVDEEWKQITGNDDIANVSQTLSSSKTFSIDLSTFDKFNLKRLSKAENQVDIKCFYDGMLYEYTRYIDLVKYLPDYVLLSQRGFVLNEEPYITNATIKSVGASPYIQCTYKINGGQEIKVSDETGLEFKKEIDFSSYSKGQHTLSLQCKDSFGIKGLEKEYIFEIAEPQSLMISNLYMYDDIREYYPSGNIIFIGENLNLDLRLRTNKEFAQCSYRIEYEDGGFFMDIIDFFKNLFGMLWENMANTDSPFEFVAEDLIFEEGSNKITIECEHTDGTSATKTYDVNQILENMTITAQRTAVN